MDKDYLLQIRVKNAPMMRAMKLNGYVTAAALSRATGVAQSVIGHYLNLRMGAFTKKGELQTSIITISEALKTMPSMLFPEQHYYESLERNTSEVEVSFDQISNVLEDRSNPQLMLENQEVKEELERMIDKLPPREREIIKERFYNDKTLLECYENETVKGECSGRFPERARQLEARAIRKLKKASATVNLTKLVGGTK